MERTESTSVIANHEIIYKNDKPYIILSLKEYERLVHSKATVDSTENLKSKKKSPAVKNQKDKRFPSGKEFMKGLEGIWKKRTDIIDSVKFVNKMRKNNSIRPHIKKQMLQTDLQK